MFWRLFICLSYALSMVFNAYTIETEQLNFQSPESTFIGKNTFYLKDDHQTFTLNDIWQKFQNDSLGKCDEKVFARPASQSSYWFVFTLKSVYGEPLWINLVNSNLDSIHYYKLDLDGHLVDQHLTGVFLGTDTRLQNAYTFWLPLNSDKDTNTYHYIIKTYSGGMMEVPIELGTFQKLMDSRLQHELFSVFFIGALTLMFFYNGFIFLFTKDKTYLYYSFYIVFIMLNTTFLNNYPIVEHLVGMMPSHLYATVWIALGYVFMGLFIITYLRLRANFKRLYWLVIGELIIVALIAISNFFVPLVNMVNLFELVVTSFVLTCLGIAYYCLYKKVPNAGVYSLGWSIMVLASVIYVMLANGILPYNIYLRNIMYMGVMIEIVVFSIALARRTNYLKQAQERLNTALRLKNEALELNNDSLDAFNYHVSHDLKTVLSNSNAMARMADKYNNLNDAEKLDEIIERLLRITNNGMETVKSFLSLGSTEVLENFEKVILRDEIEMILKFNDLSDKISVEIIEDDIVKLKINRKVMESIFLNFLTNSIKYSSQAPMARISFLTVSEGYLFVYEDNGDGIDLEKHKGQLFQPFKRFNKDKKAEGSGLGLYLLKRMINDYKGRIEVESEPNKGTRFSIYLPNHDALKEEELNYE